MNENENSLNQIFNDVADSIRAKLGTQAGIKPINFSSNIDNISGGTPTKEGVSDYLKNTLEETTLTSLFNNNDLEIESSNGNSSFIRYQSPYRGTYDWYGDNLEISLEISLHNNSEDNYVVYYNDEDYQNELYIIEANSSLQINLYINPEKYNDNKLYVIKEKDIQKVNYLVSYNNGVNESQYHVDVTALGQLRLGVLYVNSDDLNAINFDSDETLFLKTINTNEIISNDTYYVGSKNDLNNQLVDDRYNISTVSGDNIYDFIYGCLDNNDNMSTTFKSYRNINVKVYDTVQEQYIDIHKPNMAFVDSLSTIGCSEREIYFNNIALSNEIISGKTYIINKAQFSSVQTNLTLNYSINIDGVVYNVNKKYDESPTGDINFTLELNTYIPDLLLTSNVNITVTATGGNPQGVKYLDVICSSQDIEVTSAEVNNRNTNVIIDFENTTSNVMKAYNVNFIVYDENDNELFSSSTSDILLNKNETSKYYIYSQQSLYDEASKIEITFSERSYTDFSMNYIGSHTNLIEEKLCYALISAQGQGDSQYEIIFEFTNTSNEGYMLEITWEDGSSEINTTINVSPNMSGVRYIRNSAAEPENFECIVTSYLRKDITVNVLNNETSDITFRSYLTSLGYVETTIENNSDSYATLHLNQLYLADDNGQQTVSIDDNQLVFIQGNSGTSIPYDIDNFTSTIYDNTEQLIIENVEYASNTQQLTLVNTTCVDIQFNNIELDLVNNLIVLNTENTSSNNINITYSIKLYDNEDNVIYNDGTEYIHTVEGNSIASITDAVYISFQELGIIPTKVELVDYTETPENS